MLAAMSAEARRHGSIPRLIAGITAALVTAILLLLLYVFSIQAAILVLAPDRAPAVMGAFGFAETAPSPFGTWLLILSFLGALAASAVAARVHRRHFSSLFGIGNRLWPRHLLTGMGLVLGFTLATSLLTDGFSGLHPNLTPGLWVLWLLPGLAAVFVQTLAEELFFRGYLQQQLTALSTKRLVWWVLPSVLFGAAHLDFGTYGANSWLLAFATGFMALIMADVTARTGNISAALGLHFGNNIAAILIVGTPGPLSGLSLFVSPVGPADIEAMRTGIMVTILPMLPAYAFWVWIASRRSWLPTAP